MLSELTTITLTDLGESKVHAITEDPGSSAKKRPAEDSEGITSKEFWVEERGRRAKKFRVEWMNETYFKDWLRPHPTDETYCICIACNIRLRCGKSELEKHASGMKHCKKLDAMKESPNHRTQLTSLLPEGSLSQSAERVLCEENGTFFVSTGSEDDYEATTLNCSETTAATETALSKALLKFSKFLDNNSEMAKKKLQMAETEHQRRMQVLNKELELRSIQVLISQAELQKINNCVPSQGKRVSSKTPVAKDDVCGEEEEELGEEDEVGL